MSSLIHSALTVLFLSVSLCRGAESSFYRTFLSSVNSNDLTRPVAVRSPLLVDTNNTAPKLATTPLDLIKAKDTGAVGGIRLGMTMEEVVARWGKPQGLYSRCLGGPRFFYSDANVVFDPASNSVKRIVLFENFPRFADGLSASSRTEDFLHILGNPTARKDEADGDVCHLTYETRLSTLKISRGYGRLWSIQLDRPPAGAVPK